MYRYLQKTKDKKTNIVPSANSTENITCYYLQEESSVIIWYQSFAQLTPIFQCPEDYPFAPVSRKDISAVKWHDLDDLPKKSTFMKDEGCCGEKVDSKECTSKGQDAREEEY